MYNTEYECRYHRYDVFLDTDEVTDEEKSFIRDVLYKEDLLSIFYIDNSEQLDIISVLYDKIIKYNPFKYCLEKITEKLFHHNSNNFFV